MDVNDPEHARAADDDHAAGAGAVPAEDERRFTVRRVVRPPREEPKRRDASRDETELGWGDGPNGRDDEWYKRERPPHHG